MIYPNSSTTYKQKISHANRGMNLEEFINEANEYYLKHNMAIVYKKPTPIGIVEVNEEKKIITKAYFKEPSTLDYVGLYKGKYIEFDAKQTINKNSFPISNITKNQIRHIENIITHGGIAFIVLKMNDNHFIYMGKDIISFIRQNKRKSIPYIEIKEKGYLIKKKHHIMVDYLSTLSEIIGGTYEKNQID